MTRCVDAAGIVRIVRDHEDGRALALERADQRHGGGRLDGVEAGHELVEEVGHLVAAFAATDVNDDIDIGELRDSIQRYRDIQKDIHELERRLEALRALQEMRQSGQLSNEQYDAAVLKLTS